MAPRPSRRRGNKGDNQKDANDASRSARVSRRSGRTQEDPPPQEEEEQSAAAAPPQRRSNRGGRRASQQSDPAADAAAAAPKNQEDSSEDSDDMEIPDKPFHVSKRYERDNKKAIAYQRALAKKAEEARRRSTESQGSGAAAAARVSQDSTDSAGGSGSKETDKNNSETTDDPDKEKAARVARVSKAVQMAREALVNPDRARCIHHVAGRRCCNDAMSGSIMCKKHEKFAPKGDVLKSSEGDEEEGAQCCDDNDRDATMGSQSDARMSRGSSKSSVLVLSRKSVGTSQNSVSFQEVSQKGKRKKKKKGHSSQASSTNHRSRETSQQSVDFLSGSSQNSSKFAYKSSLKDGRSQFAADGWRGKYVQSPAHSFAKRSQTSSRNDASMPPPRPREKAADEEEDSKTIESFKPPAEVSPESQDPLKRKHDELDDEELSMQGLEEETTHKKPRALDMNDGECDPEEPDKEPEKHGDEDDPETPEEKIPDSVPSAPLKPPEAGIIMEIKLKDFMNHRNILLELGPNINFIHGKNGSGKSAFLAALQVALGGTAWMTKRYKRMSDFICKNSPTIRRAVIRVKFKNAGVDAFHPDLYGHEVIVEKIINKTGGNELRLRSHRGKIISRSKDDLVEMLDKWNVLIENPVSILTQESAKEFLRGSSKAKYKFFQGATDLGRLSEHYNDALKCLKDLLEEVARLEHSFEDLREAEDSAKREYDQHRKVNAMEQTKAKIEEDLAWAKYKTFLEEEVQKELMALEEIKEKLAAENGVLRVLEKELQEDAGNEVSLLEDLKRLEAEEKESKKDLNAFNKVKKEDRGQLKDLKIELNRTRREMKDIKEELDDALRALEMRRGEIARQGEIAQAERQGRTRRLEIRTQQLENARQELENARRNTATAQSEHDNKASEVRVADTLATEAEGVLQTCSEHIASLQERRNNRGENNRAALFGIKCAQIKDLVDEYSAAGRFKDEVLGPIGCYCRIKNGKEEFGGLAEAVIGGGFLDRFVVFNDHDRKVYQQLRSRVGAEFNCGVLQMDHHERYNVPNPPEGVDTAATVLDIAHDDVFNCLVDFCKIEKRALFRSKEESEQRLLQSRENGVYSMAVPFINDVRFLPRGDQWHIKRGALSLTSYTKTLTNRLGISVVEEKNVAEQLRNAETEKQAAVDSFNQRKQELQTLKVQLENIKSNLRERKSQQRRRQRTIRDITSAIEEIRSEENEANDDLDQDTSEEEEAIERLKESWSTKDAKCTSILKRYGDTMTLITEKEHDLEEEKARSEQLSRDIRAAQEKQTAYTQRHGRLQSLRAVTAKIQSDLGEQQDRVHDVNEKADRHCHRAKLLVATHRNAEAQRTRRVKGIMEAEVSADDIEIPDLQDIKDISYYTARIMTIQKKIDKELEKLQRGESEDMASAYEAYCRAKALYESKTATCKEYKILSHALKEDVRLRESRWLLFRAYISDLVDAKFGETLTLRDSSGRVLFDHKNKTLVPTFVPDSQSEANEQRSVKGLSGGERSLSTIALLLALGETTENPFRAMDEFDVFLDAVTRKKIIDHLIKVGKNKSNRQFIFLTPQDISDVAGDEMIKILRMKDPKRQEAVP